MNPNPEHQFNPSIEKTEIEIAKFIADLISKMKDTLIFSQEDEKDPEKEQAYLEAGNDFGIEVIKFISSTDIPADYAGHAIGRLSTVLNTLQRYVDGTVRQDMGEFVSRSLEVRSPLSGKYRAEVVTYAQLLTKLSEVREKQGNVRADYFEDQKASTPSPYQENGDTSKVDEVKS